MIFQTILFWWWTSLLGPVHPAAQEALAKVGSPYVVGSLENKNEEFVYRTDAFDCFTLVEYCTAKTLASKQSKPFAQIIEHNRYVNGKRLGYGSRLHYFAGWAEAGVQQGWLTRVSHPSGQTWKKKIDYMSTHRKYYPTYVPVKEWASVQQQEKELSQLTLVYYPKETLSKDLSFIQTGDIIAFTSHVAGLDVNHEGIAYWKNKQLHFIHASSEEKKVVISKETLVDYLHRIKSHSGLMIYRLVI